MKGYVHCDIKPENIMIGDFEKDPELKKKIYLIDFGISHRYLDDNGNHIEYKRNVPFKGNLLFSSKNAFSRVTLSRRDDLMSLIYLLIFCINTDIAWIDNNISVSD